MAITSLERIFPPKAPDPRVKNKQESEQGSGKESPDMREILQKMKLLVNDTEEMYKLYKINHKIDIRFKSLVEEEENTFQRILMPETKNLFSDPIEELIKHIVENSKKIGSDSEKEMIESLVNILQVHISNIRNSIAKSAVANTPEIKHKNKNYLLSLMPMIDYAHMKEKDRKTILGTIGECLKLLDDNECPLLGRVSPSNIPSSHNSNDGSIGSQNSEYSNSNSHTINVESPMKKIDWGNLQLLYNANRLVIKDDMDNVQVKYDPEKLNSKQDILQLLTGAIKSLTYYDKTGRSEINKDNFKVEYTINIEITNVIESLKEIKDFIESQKEEKGMIHTGTKRIKTTIIKAHYSNVSKSYSRVGKLHFTKDENVDEKISNITAVDATPVNRRMY
mgnify:CR=1 FL=1